MERFIKEHFSSKYFSSFGYIVAVCYVPALVIFAAYTGWLRTNERRLFSCPSSRDDCLVKYDEQFNSPFPLYGFVLLCFVPPLAVCIAYSWCFVKSRVDELEAALKPDPENPRPRPRVTTRRVFYSYSLHLFVRLVLGIFFILLQNFLFYPDGFPTEFFCVSLSFTVNATVNSTVMNVTKDDYSAINCDNSVGSEKAIGAKGIWIVNVLFAFLVFVELLYLLVQGKRSEQFTFDSEFCPKYFFNKSRTPVTLRDYTLRMKRQIREETDILEPLIAQPAESNKLLEDIFVDLVIYTGRAQNKFVNFSKRHEIFDIYLKPQRGALPIKKLQELFLPNEDTQDPRKILVVGRPGIGKSLLCKKLWRDWSKGSLLCDSNKIFKHIFLFQFRWFNTGTLEKISLKQLISLLCPEESIDNEVFQYMLDNPEKVLLVFDGLDEFKHHECCLEDEKAQGGNGATEVMPLATLYVKLMKGKQLPGATVVTTCRPNVVQSAAGLKFDRRVEIMGFTPAKVDEYVHKFCAHDTATASRIWGHISSDLELLSLCYIPANSSIVCSFLEKLITVQDQDSGCTLPTTSTEIYKGALRFFIYRHHPEYRGKPLTKDCLMGDVDFTDSVEKTLSQVGTLAKTGIEKSQLIFDATEVQGMQDCGLFNQMQDIPVSNFRYKSQYCFIHLTLQEFLAAREIAKMDPSDLSDFITSNASDPKWHMVIQFTAGLLRGQENEAANSFINLLCDFLTAEPKEKNKTKQKLKILLMFKCLHEYNNETMAKKAACELQNDRKFRHLIDLSASQVTPADCTAIAFFIKHLHALTELNLYSNKITAQGVSHLCDALKDVNCKLTELNLSSNNITDQGVSHLCDALKDVNCKLTKLNLYFNNITDQGLSHLCDALKDVNCKLNKLNLSSNGITDRGISHLCDALKDANCKLTELNLSSNNITAQGVSRLCDALKDVNCKLTKLNLYFNNITDQGVSHLCYALKNVNCKLAKLNLSSNNITDQGVSNLCDALADVNCKLTELNLSSNTVTDHGASYLCDALKDMNCKLTKLNLYFNNITDQGVSHLRDALKHVNCMLNKLNLSSNNITAQGVSHLCDALEDANCKLTELNLYFSNITNEDVSYLCDAIKGVNCKLTNLNLSNNNVTDQGVSYLCDALKDVNCKLTELNLSCSSNITDQGVSHLCDALKDKNCKLTKLNLSNNKITDQGELYLCDALGDVNCKLSELTVARRPSELTVA